MSWTSIIAIYALFWVMTAFVILPIGVRTPMGRMTNAVITQKSK